MFWVVLSQTDDGVTLRADVAFWPDQAAHDRGDAPMLMPWSSLGYEDFVLPRPDRLFTERVTDGGGQLKRADGTFVIPWVEVNGQWQAMPEDPANPWVFVSTPLDMGAELAHAVSMFIESHGWA